MPSNRSNTLRYSNPLGAGGLHSIFCYDPGLNLSFHFFSYYFYIVLYCCVFLFHHFSQRVMDNIWYSSITLTAALKMSLRHHHISLRASILPHPAPARASSSLCLLSLSSLPCLPHPFNLLLGAEALEHFFVFSGKKAQHIWSDQFLNKGFKMM